MISTKAFSLNLIIYLVTVTIIITLKLFIEIKSCSSTVIKMEKQLSTEVQSVVRRRWHYPFNDLSSGNEALNIVYLQGDDKVTINMEK